jgi:hypothetical protein
VKINKTFKTKIMLGRHRPLEVEEILASLSLSVNDYHKTNGKEGIRLTLVPVSHFLTSSPLFTVSHMVNIYTSKIGKPELIRPLGVVVSICRNFAYTKN